jgi:hypothetical protein
MSEYESADPTPVSIDDSLDPAVADNPTSSPSHDEKVARLAHQFWEERGCVDGHDVEDWLRAEREILESEQQETKSKRSIAATS